MNKYKFVITVIFLIILSSILILNDVFTNEKYSSNPTKTYAIEKEEFVLVYIGSSTCPFCQKPALKEVYKSLKNRLEFISDSLGYSFKTIGTSVDFDIKEGVSHLSSIDDFDEISTGSGYNNLIIKKYLWDHEIPLRKIGTPQVLVLKREYFLPIENGMPFRLNKSEFVVERETGGLSINGLVESLRQIEGIDRLIN